MYVYVCVGVCVCTHMCVGVYIYIYIYIYIHTHTYMGAHTHTHVCIHVFAYIQLIVSHLMAKSIFIQTVLFQRIQSSISHHHHHVVLLARISLTLSRHFSLSFTASGRSSGLHPVSSHSCCMYVRAGRPALAWPYMGVHRSTSHMSSSLLLQQ